VDAFAPRIRRLLDQAAQDGELREDVNLDRIVHECLTLVDGLSIQAVMYPAKAGPPEQLAMLDALLDRVRAPR